MYVKLYRYKIKKRALSKWKKAAYGSAKIYKRYGDTGKWLVLVKKEKNCISIIDMSIYKSKMDFLKIKTKTDKDESIRRLFLTFKETLYSKRIVEEDLKVLRS